MVLKATIEKNMPVFLIEENELLGEVRILPNHENVSESNEFYVIPGSCLQIHVTNFGNKPIHVSFRVLRGNRDGFAGIGIAGPDSNTCIINFTSPPGDTFYLQLKSYGGGCDGIGKIYLLPPASFPVTEPFGIDYD